MENLSGQKEKNRRGAAEKQLCTALLAHVDAGKTTLSECMLYQTGSIRSMGRVDHRDTFLDTSEMERQRGITIFSRQANIVYKDLKLTFLDTPGHVDFSAETERVLWVLDAAVLVISGSDGVQGHTRTLWRLLEQLKVPVFVFVNKMDIAHRSREELMAHLREELSDGCVDVTDMVKGNWSEEEREELALCSEELMELYLSGESGDGSGLPFPGERMAEAVTERALFPCIFGSALRNQGVSELLEALRLFSEEKTYGEAFGARVFKIGRDSRGDRLTYLKLTGGKLNVRAEISYETVSGTFREKINQIRQYSGDRFDTLDGVHAGEICAVTGLTKTVPGMALGEERQAPAAHMQSVLSYRIIPPPDCTPHRLLECVRLLEEEDPQLHVRWEEETQELSVSLMGEVQTQVLKTMIFDRFGIAVTFGEGSILYKETITVPTEGVGHFEPLRHYAEAHVLLEPLPAGSGVEVAADCPSDLLDRNWQRLICTHLREREHPGVLLGAPVTDVRMTVVAGKSHPKHTEGGDFRQAAYRAVRQGLKKAECILLEPFYRITLTVPVGCVGRAMTDLNRMEAKTLPPEMGQDTAVLKAEAPVSRVGNYAAQVASYTGGQGRLTLEIAGYFPCLNQQEVLENAGYDSEADAANPAGSVFCSHGAGYLVPWYEVEERMHVPMSGRAEELRGQALEGDAPGHPAVSEQEIMAQAKARAERQRSRQPAGYDGYGGLESDLQEIFVREFGEIRRPGEKSSRQTVRYEKQQRIREAREMYDRQHSKTENAAAAPAGKKKEYFLVDGYNVIYAWPDLADLAAENLEGARGKLADILCDYQGYAGCEMILVFDAYRVKGNPGEVQKYHNIYIVYTREAETADAYIERTTHEIASRAAVTVATSDALEQMIVIGEGARRMSSREFREEIARVKTESLARYGQTQ